MFFCFSKFGSSKINLGLLLYVVENQSVIIDDAEVETLYLLQNPANAERLSKGIEQHRQGEYREIDVKAFFASRSSRRPR
ncbi:hypothetical protein PN36_23225 [Candidatus Thiomargarita nelsonii]|uniref:Uncharacterized protein n=1 Tax=Candidatus Thiomargarita nelsonii TaxID=1003181 RepID=A0A0A6PFP2_9GAMM|nr:hypothetical protein PN36_23225 [Candidatus Thiomargarita nelsonii]